MDPSHVRGLAARCGIAGLVASAFAGVWLPPILTLGGIHLRANQVVLGAIVIVWAVSDLPRWRILPAPGSRAAALLGGSFLISTLLFSDPVLPACSQALLLLLNLATYLALYSLVHAQSSRLYMALQVVGACTVLTAGWSVLAAVGARYGWSGFEKLAFLENLRIVEAGNDTSQWVPRLWNSTIGGSLLAAVAVTAVALGQCRRRERGRWLLVGGAAATGVAASAARGPLLTLVVGFALYAYLTARNPRRLLRAMLTVLIGAVCLRFALSHMSATAPIAGMLEGKVLSLVDASDYTQGTAGDRLAYWGAMIQDLGSNPLFGRGALAYRRFFPFDNPASENFPLEVAHSAGVFGAAGLTVCLGAVVRRAWRSSRKQGGLEGCTAGALLAGFIGLLAASFTNPVAWSGLFWVFLGLLASATRLAELSLKSHARLRPLEPWSANAIPPSL